MKRILSFIYGLIAYLTFLMTFLYLIGFEENLLVPKSLDSAPTENLTIALLINLALIGLFGLQHSGMARPGFKKWCLKTIPSHLDGNIVNYPLTSTSHVKVTIPKFLIITLRGKT